ncbi:MAG TPA: D-glucuronyl C5-epimerase family protein [Solirubrobacteraceae bacterium]|nr:D-glucuronyl C5-epimerase family protein [Solirubrobacteraceae bacterium]
MCRTRLAGPLLALLLALALAPTAVASPLLTMRSDGTTFAREDRFLPPAVPDVPVAHASRPAPAAGMRRFGARAAAKRRTVRGELARLLAAGTIDRATHDDRRAIYADALRLRRKLRGARRAALGAVLRNLENIAAAGGLTAGRLPALFETVRRNRAWWANGPLLRHGARVSFQGSRLVWQHYAGEGLQIQWLGTFGKLNGLWQGGYSASLRELAREAVALAAQRSGGIAWEYLFRFGGGRPPWVSAMAQATAVQALARAGTKLAEPAYLEAARAALGVFREAPPGGVRVATPAGAHYLIYSFAPRLRVLNGFTQAVSGLHDYAELTGDPEGIALFAAGESQLRTELPAYDTGAWSRYSLERDADLHYHRLARDFLRNLCARLSADTTAPAAGATGGAVAVPQVPIADPAPYCGAAQRWTAYLNQPPVVRLVSRRVRGGKPASIRVALSKPSYVTLRLRRGGRTVVVLGGQLASGVRTLRWPRPPRSAGRVTAVLDAEDLAGNRSAAEGALRVLKARSRR